MDQNHQKMTAEEALQLIIDANLTVNQYLKICAKIKLCCGLILPSYADVSKEKKKCHPEGILVTSQKAEVPVNELVKHTARRIFAKEQKDLNIEIKNDITKQMEMTEPLTVVLSDGNAISISMHC
ncbi:CLUMA_CG016656, isoform A [Clunio marinus]|uniref:CLUMA_CG016656, isoform A n=1 Tax=Clunio marinus TaxID=568069 RepID=A0A1J1ITW4_9DIPT|nr:CLUMA_CG016656, isoform A [Clunio marinus]